MQQRLTRFVSILFFLIVFETGQTAFAQLVVGLDTLEQTSDKTLVRITLKNEGQQAVRAARAWVFLMNDAGEVVGQKSQWVLGGKTDDANTVSGLPSSETYTVTTAIAANAPFTQTKVLFPRIILEDGSMPDPNKYIQFSGKQH